jgi:hypothetical protein
VVLDPPPNVLRRTYFSILAECYAAAWVAVVARLRQQGALNANRIFNFRAVLGGAADQIKQLNSIGERGPTIFSVYFYYRPSPSSSFLFASQCTHRKMFPYLMSNIHVIEQKKSP